ncbi:WG repeat-containing protein [Kaistella sp. PBT33-4]|uniref:WG repeat-containing protein n=1 Tax=Kaistella sp. PBT33-4 TaxID=3032000 RepID=UPI0023D8A300|nr:WG repeat-containing protein [Kaistella sp. PBT33-4]MDF0720529.1 WG repeat-containing protein [Kaistella sp. PBT33-4]
MNYYINQTGRTIYFHILGEKLYGKFYIFSKQGRLGIQSHRYEIIIFPLYDAIKPAFDQHFWGKTENRWRLYNFKNRQIGSHSFQRVEPYNLEFAAVSTSGKSWGFINRNGMMVITPEFHSGNYLGLDYFAVSVIKCGRPCFGVTDSSGNIIIPFSLSVKPTFSDTVLYLLNKRKPLREWLKL